MSSTMPAWRCTPRRSNTTSLLVAGGWTKARLHVMHGDGHTLTVEFLASAPPPGMTVIDVVVPVEASAEFKGRATSVHVLADENEMTSQVLH